jgi:hypothetical protein
MVEARRCSVCRELRIIFRVFVEFCQLFKFTISRPLQSLSLTQTLKSQNPYHMTFDFPLLWEICIGSATLLATGALLIYPAAVPHLRDLEMFVFESPLMESVILPLAFWQCLEKIALMKPSVGALSPIIVVLLYALYLFAWRAFHENMHEPIRIPEVCDEADDEKSEGGSTASEAEEEESEGCEPSSTSSVEETDGTVNPSLAEPKFEIECNDTEERPINPLEVSCQDDVFTILQKSEIQTPE